MQETREARQGGGSLRGEGTRVGRAAGQMWHREVTWEVVGRGPEGGALRMAVGREGERCSRSSRVMGKVPSRSGEG